MAIDAKPTAQVFDLRTAYLDQGRNTDMKARTDRMTLAMKVYAEGGENNMHHHPDEDHSFVVLEGQATFHLETDDNVVVLGPNQGIMLPRGANYWFQSTADQNLVMIRVGATTGDGARTSPVGLGGRLTPDGNVGDAAYYRRGEKVERPGKRFGE